LSLLGRVDFAGAALAETSESAFNVGKLAALGLVLVVGLFASGLDWGRLAPAAWASPTANVASGMIGRLASEGFELIADASDQIVDPKRTLPPRLATIDEPPSAFHRSLHGRSVVTGGEDPQAGFPDGSGVSREAPAPFRERPAVKFLRPVRHETFRALETRGYEREHDFGRGKRPSVDESLARRSPPKSELPRRRAVT
jgi:hypothetical protein